MDGRPGLGGSRSAQRGFLRAVALILVLMLILIAAGGIFAYSGLFRLQLATQETHQTERVSQTLSSISRELGHIRNLSTVLKNSLAVQRALNAGHAPDLVSMNREFLNFARSVQAISQVRWLDLSGRERVRVNVVQGEPRTVPPTELQNKADRYYFREALEAPAGTVYLSRLDLNIENGAVVRPLEPTLRAVIRTGEDDGLHPGVLIINYNLAPYFDHFRELADEDSQLELIDQNGYWLLSRDPAREWGFQLGKPEQTLARTTPGLWKRIATTRSADNLIYRGRLYSFARLDYDPDKSDGRAHGHLYVLAVTHRAALDAIRSQLLLPIVLSCLLVLTAGLLLIRRLVNTHFDRVRLADELQRGQERLERAYDDLQRSHENLQLLQDELVESRKLASLGMMVAGVAHELNTPTGGALMAVSTLKTKLELLQRGVRDGLTRSQLDDYIAGSATGLKLADAHLQRAAELIRSFKRLAVDRSHGEMARFDLATSMADLANSLQHRFRQSPVRLEMNVPERLELCGYPGILSQVVQNLVENALNHAFGPDEKGIVRVSAATADSGRSLALCVADDGNGIDPALTDSLFDPFVTSGRHEGHTGLGLHLTHQWVHQLLKGTIEVESVPGEGTTVTVRVPVDLSERAVFA